MAALGPNLKEVANNLTSSFPFSKTNLPKQLFINNEVRIPQTPTLDFIT